ncbi:MAG: hypothetical protein IKT67_07710 [Lachnospiraceae bacterium]|nr:hypothetical protein [Lachnospiraceae bacterium]
MKKIFFTLMCGFFALLSAALATPTQAEAALKDTDSIIVSEHIETLEDGSYFHVTVSELVSPSESRSVQTQHGSREITYHDANGVALWKYTLYGTFQFIPGSSAACISSSYSIDIYDSSWENTYASASKSGNQAIGDGTFIKKVLLITTHTENVHATLTCSAYGTLS